MAMKSSPVTIYHFIHDARVWLSSQIYTKHCGQHLISVSNQDVFARWQSTLSSGEACQLNNSRSKVYRHTQELQTQAAYKQIFSDHTIYYIKHLIFTTCGRRLGAQYCFFPIHLHLCLSENLRLNKWNLCEKQTISLSFSFNVIPHLLTSIILKNT